MNLMYGILPFLSIERVVVLEEGTLLRGQRLYRRRQVNRKFPWTSRFAAYDSTSRLGCRFQKIADTLNSDGLLTKQGRRWTRGTVHNVYQNRGGVAWEIIYTTYESMKHTKN
ncbi:MAG: recombinase family protein [Desulfovibrio sp.]|nr:recombinase family protein [Desulfovibrio sp.]